MYIRNPDAIYETGSFTFIYDPKKNKFYFEEFPVKHSDLLFDNPIASLTGKDLEKYMGDWRDARDLAVEERIPLGRAKVIGDTLYIIFWNDLESIQEYIKKTLSLVVDNVSKKDGYDKVQIKFKDSELLLPVMPELAYHTLTDFGLPSTKSTTKGAKEEEFKVNIDGKETTLAQIASSLHMVRGQQLDKIKATFCPHYRNLAKALVGNHRQFTLLNHIYKALNCDNFKQAYKHLYDAGKTRRKQELTTLLGEPEKLSQREINRYWDELQRLNFKEWLISHLSS